MIRGIYMSMNAIDTERIWWEDDCKTWDDQDHNYRATEYLASYGTLVRITFQDYGSFTSFSEEAAVQIFQKWYKKHVKTPENDLSDPVRKPSVRNVNANL